jgi:hypothetical protein
MFGAKVGSCAIPYLRDFRFIFTRLNLYRKVMRMTQLIATLNASAAAGFPRLAKYRPGMGRRTFLLM